MKIPVIQENFIDRLIEQFAPGKALERRQARMSLAMTSQWTAGRKDKKSLRSLKPKGVSPDVANEGNLSPRDNPRATMMFRARDLTRNNPLAQGALGNVTMSAVGTGLRLQCQIDNVTLGISEEEAVKWQTRTEKLFELWAVNRDYADVAKNCNFYEQQDVVLAAALTDGDCFYIMPQLDDKKFKRPYRLAVQLIAADRCSNPEDKANQFGPGGMVGGIQLGSYSDPVKYYFAETAQDDPRNGAKPRKWVAYDAFDSKGRRVVHHLLTVKEIGQTRGVSYFAPVIDFFHNLGKYTDAELTAAVVSSFFTVFVSSKSGSQLPALDIGGDYGTGSSPEKSDDENEMRLGQGSIIETDMDTQVNVANPGRPNDKFEPFVKAVYEQIGVGLHQPVEVLTKHFQSSYSAAKGALLEAWKFFRMKRTWVARNYCQPVYERWMDEAVARGIVVAPGYFDSPFIRAAWLGSQWIGENQGSLDPLKEANAAKIWVDMGAKDLDQVSLEETGQTYMEKHPKIAKIAKLRKEAGLGEQVAAPGASNGAGPDPGGNNGGNPGTGGN